LVDFFIARSSAWAKKKSRLFAGTSYVDLFVILLCCQQKHSRPTGKVEIKIKVKETVCSCDIHNYPKNNN
jgi:hypothetical protein